MKINGLNGNSYVVEEAPDLSQVLAVIQVNERSLVYVGQPMALVFRVGERVVEIEVPAGFEWDGASIPGFAQWLIGRPLDSDFRVPSLVHDSGYEDRSRRVLQDVIFYYLLRQGGVPRWKSTLMYVAVRVGGHVYYASETSRFWRGVKGVLGRI